MCWPKKKKKKASSAVRFPFVNIIVVFLILLIINIGVLFCTLHSFWTPLIWTKSKRGKRPLGGKNKG